MTNQQLKNSVQNLISRASTQEALDLIDKWAYENNLERLKKDVSLLKSNLARLSRERNMGMISFSDAHIQTNQLTNSILNLLNDLEEPKAVPDLGTPGPEPGQSQKVILLITASPNNLAMPNVGRQQRAIKEALKDKRKEDLFTIKIIGFVQPEDLIDEIEAEKPDIIHFFMHNDTEEGLYFENGNGDIIPILPDDMAAIFETITGTKKLECVVLNACNSNTHVAAISPFVPTIVYTKDFVPDEVSGGNNDTIASLFTRKFYEQVFSEKSYPDAVKRANVALKLSKMPLSAKNTNKIDEIFAIQTA